MTESVLEVESLRRKFGARYVVWDLDFTVNAGQRVALVGPNGSGKSTTLRCVAGSLFPTAGSVRVCGHAAGSLAARRRLGVSLSQERSFFLRLSGAENLKFFARLRGYSRSAAVQEVSSICEELELGDFIDKRADEYSTGMILQLAFARSLLGDPSLLVLDEPTRSLDEEASERLWRALDRRRESALLIATHRKDDVERCDASVELEP